jgi:hypothetical protein
MGKMITIVCDTCNEEVDKPEKEIKRQKKKGRTKFYCSLSCSKIDTGATDHLKEWVKSDDNKKLIRKNCADNRDEFTGFREYIRRARKRKHEVIIDLPYLKKIWEEQDGKCAYTNVPLTHPVNTKSLRQYNYMASLDRIDSSLGYVEGNLQFVSVTCNWLKNSLDDNHIQEFFKIVRGCNGFD